MRYDLLHPKALHAALVEHMGPGYPVPAVRQVRRWVVGDTPLPGWARRAIDELMDTTKEALRPAWAEGLFDRLDSILENQSSIIEEQKRTAESVAPLDRLLNVEGLRDWLEGQPPPSVADPLDLPDMEGSDTGAREGQGSG